MRYNALIKEFTLFYNTKSYFNIKIKKIIIQKIALI